MGRKRVTSLAVAIHSSFLKENKSDGKRDTRENKLLSVTNLKLCYQQLRLNFNRMETCSDIYITESFFQLHGTPLKNLSLVICHPANYKQSITLVWETVTAIIRSLKHIYKYTKNYYNHCYV